MQLLLMIGAFDGSLLWRSRRPGLRALRREKLKLKWTYLVSSLQFSSPMPEVFMPLPPSPKPGVSSAPDTACFVLFCFVSHPCCVFRRRPIYSQSLTDLLLTCLCKIVAVPSILQSIYILFLVTLF